VPLAAGRCEAISGNADAGGASPATPAALPILTGGTGVHTGFITTLLIRIRWRNSVAQFAFLYANLVLNLKKYTNGVVKRLLTLPAKSVGRHSFRVQC